MSRQIWVPTLHQVGKIPAKCISENRVDKILRVAQRDIYFVRSLGSGDEKVAAPARALEIKPLKYAIAALSQMIKSYSSIQKTDFTSSKCADLPESFSEYSCFKNWIIVFAIQFNFQ
jgi:hypothetical protein